MADGIKFLFPSVTTKIIAVWYRQTNPTVEAGRQVFNPSAEAQVLVPAGLLADVYIFKFYGSSNGVALETLLTEWAIDGSMLGGSTSFEPYYYRVGFGGDHDPAANQNQLLDDRLKGKNIIVFTKGTGLRAQSDYVVLDAGGIEWTTGENFELDDEITIIAYAGVAASNNPSVSSGSVEDIHIVSANSDFDASYYGKTNVAEGAATILKTVFPDFALIPSGTVATFNTYGGAQRYWTLQFAAGNTVRYAGQDRNVIHLAPNEMIKFIWKAVGGVIKCYVLDDNTRYDQTGEFIESNYKNKFATVLGDGSEVNIADYIRIHDELLPEMVTTYDGWNQYTDVTIGEITKRYYPNRKKFAINALAGKMKLPDLRGFSKRVLQDYTGVADAQMLSQGPGGVWTQMMIKHGHRVNTTGNQSGVNPGRGLQRAATDGDGYTDAANGKGTGSKGPYIELVGGEENRVDSYGQYGLIGL